MRLSPKRLSQERRWVFFNNGCLHGIQHSRLVVVRRMPSRSVSRDSVAVFSVSRTFGFIAALSAIAFLVLLLTACLHPRGQKGGGATATIRRPGHNHSATLAQSENPRQPSRQTVQSQQTVEYVLPAG